MRMERRGIVGEGASRKEEGRTGTKRAHFMKDPRLFTGPPFAEPAPRFARRVRLLGPCPTPTCPQLVHLLAETVSA